MAPTSKERILAAARALFGELGYPDTTFKRIAEKSGVALGLITHYFGSKEKLFVASCLSVLDEIQVAVAEGIEGKETGLEAITGFVRSYFDFTIAAGPDFMVLVRCSPYSDLKGEVNKDEVVSRFEGLVRILSDLLARGMDDGTVVRGDAFRIANAIFASIVGSVRTRLLNPFCPPGYYTEAVEFIRRAVAND